MVFKLHASGDTWLTAAGCSVSELIRSFERDRPTVNPVTGSSRLSAVAGAYFSFGGELDAIAPEHLAFFSPAFTQPGLLDRLPELGEFEMRICGPLLHSGSHPVLLNPYYTLSVLQHAAASHGFVLPEDVCKKILDLVPWNWRSTTVGEVIRKVAAETGAQHEADVKLIGTRGDLVSHAQAEMPVAELLGFTTAVVSGLNYAIFRDPPPNGHQLNLKVVTQDGNEIFYKCRGSTVFYKLMRVFCDRHGISVNSVRFFFDGQRIYPYHTPHQLEMEDGDSIEVLVEQHGD